ncbi:hypothetical protein [Acinetobacter sp.]|uniref:hypothetical protein n=1 Tax=Acinetobacter sp. TaxID=472 RepID=UPI00388FE6A1
MVFSREERRWQIGALIQCFIALAISFFVMGIHKERTDIRKKPAASFSEKYLAISSKSKQELVELMNREDIIIGVSTISISLISNTRQITFFKSENSGLKNAWEKYMASRTKIPSVFTNDYYQNTRITEIINGNFECRLTKDTAIGKLYPAEKFAPYVCSISVPPAFDESGDFLGYINFFLKGPITDSEKARIAKEAVIVSQNIYHRDIQG